MSAPEIPKTCKAGVMHNEGPDYKVTIEDVEVPKPGELPAKNRSGQRF